MAGQFGLRFRIPRKSQGSLTCRTSATWDRRLYFPSEGSHAWIFSPEKILQLRLVSNPRSWLLEASMLTTRSRVVNQLLLDVVVMTDLIFMTCISLRVGWDSSVGIATCYGLEGLGIESHWGGIFRTCPDQPWGPPSLLYHGEWVLPGDKTARVCHWLLTPI
jgi:hypothetical protein